MTKLLKSLTTTRNFAYVLQIKLQYGDTDAIMTAASDANEAMNALAVEASNMWVDGDITDQQNHMIKAAQELLNAANEEDGTTEMASLCVQALEIAKQLTV